MASLCLRFSILRWQPLYLRSWESTASWLCYYRALQEGPASVVVPIDKLSILVTVAFSALMLREGVSGRYLLGIAGMCAGAVLMVIG
ncbi:EamA family transporter [Actinomyces sp.]